MADEHHTAHRSAKAKREIFCAHCQAPTKHVCSVDHNKEVLCTCDGCGRALKFPFPTDAAHMASMLDTHHKANQGQISTEKAQAERAAIDEEFKKLMGA